MKKIILLVIIGLLMAVPAFAIDLGKGVTLDGYWTGGKIYQVSKEDLGAYEKIGLTSIKDSFYTSGEIGVRYGVIRPFVGYETLTHDYSKTSIGSEAYFGTWQGMAFGVRAQYTAEKKYGADKQRYIYTGLMVRF